MKSTLQVLAVVAAVVAVCGANTQIKKCEGDVAPSIDDVQVKLGNCTQGPCVLKRGRTYRLEQQFKAPVDAESLQSIVIGLPHGPLASATDCEACDGITNSDGSKGECPLKKGQTYTYSKTFRLTEREPQDVYNLEWHLNNEGDEPVSCFQVPIKFQ